MEQLIEENKQLKKDLEFFYKIYDYPSALVYQMQIKTKNNQKVWINTQTITKKELLELDQDDEIKKLIVEKDARYNDNDW